MKAELHSLKNGLRVVLIPMMDTDTATVVVMVGTGSRYESKKENGLAHFLEHMFFKGTKRRPSAKAIAEELDSIGALNNAYTAKNRTAYYAKAESTHVEKIVDIVSDMYLHSSLPQKEIDKERGTIIQEINMYEDIPMRSVHDVFEALIFDPNHPLGRTILGPKKNILAFTREDFRNYMNRTYIAGNTVVCVAGNFSKKKVLRRIKKEFSTMRVAEVPSFGKKEITQTTKQVALKYKKTDQSHLILGVPSYPLEHKDEVTAEVVAAILGQGMSSRFFTEIREKRGLAYSVHAWTDAYVDIGNFAAYAGVEHKNLEKAIQTMLGEIKKIKREKVTSRELKKAKEFLKGHLSISHETTDAIAFTGATSVLLRGKIVTIDEMKKKIDAVTVSDIQRVAKDIFRKEMLNLAIIGPHTKKARFERMLTL